MLYLSQMIGEPVVDAQGERLGTISDLAISTGEVFPRITSLAFQGPGRVPFMISWRKYVDTFDDDGITLSVDAHDIRFSYLQPDEVLLARDLMDRQIVDTQGLKVVRVNDLKLSQSGTQLRLLGAEVGVRGILRGLGYEGRVTSPTFAIANEYETPTVKVAHFDLYRILDSEALFEIGFDEYLDGSRIVLIEWSENAADVLPEAYKTVHIAYGAADNDRRITIGEVTV